MLLFSEKDDKNSDLEYIAKLCLMIGMLIPNLPCNIKLIGGGLTVIQAQGRGKGERPMLESPRGTGMHKAQFNTLESIVVVVDDSKVDSVVN